MSNKANKGSAKKVGKVKKEEEPAPDLINKDGNSLHDMIKELKDKATDLQSKRSYVENERDLLEKFSKNTKQEIDDVRMLVSNKATFAEQIEQDHRVEVKVYLQKVKHLEYDQKINARQAEQEGDNNIKVEDEYHHQRLKDLQKNKSESKKQYLKNEDTQQIDIKQLEQHQKKTLKMLNDDYDRKIQTMEDKYEDTLVKLRKDLELKLKVEIHEIEERKNQHINELLRNHEAAFAELKSYYNEITAENLNLIRSQKQRLEELRGSSKVNDKLISEIKGKNRAMEDPIEKNTKLRDDLKYALRLHEKDIMSLDNLRIKFKTLKDKIIKTEREQDIIDARYEQVIKEKKELEDRFENIASEVKNRSDAKNVVLSQKLGVLSDKLEAKEAQTQHLLKTSQMDPNLANQVFSRIQNSIEGKNSLTKNLQYSINHATKAYNDAIRVYEAKLIEFGVPQDELGFQTLESRTSMMPAGLVSS